MPRVREFDEDAALTRAMELFWEKGFADTSVRDLVSHTGVAHAGLYSAFGDKEGLYRAALEKYVREVIEVFKILESEDAGREQIEAFFKNMVRKAKSGEAKNGCMITNNAVEFGGSDTVGGVLAEKVYSRQLRAFKNALGNASRKGEIPGHVKVDETAKAMVGMFYGLTVLLRSGVPTATIQSAINATLKLLE